MKNAVRIFTVVLLALLLCVTMIACSHDEDEHVASGDWQTSETHHWKGCEDECEGAEVDKAEHTFDNACDADCNVCAYKRTPAAHAYDNACDATCNVCAATRAITHDHAATLTKGDTTHYYACSVCGDKKDEAPHAFNQSVAHSEYLKTAATATTKAVYYKSCVCGKAGTETFETDKTAVTVTITAAGNKSFDGVAAGAPTYTVTPTDVQGVQVLYKVKNADDSTYTTDAPVAVGVYTVKVNVPESATHAGASATAELTISKGAAEITDIDVTNTGKTYDGNPVNAPEFAANFRDGATVEYKVKDADDSTYTTDVPVNAGNYTVRVRVPETDNYTGDEMTADFTIAKATATIESITIGDNITYGTPIAPMANTDVNYTGEFLYEYKAFGADDSTYDTVLPQAVGQYVVRATLLDTDNYNAVSYVQSFQIVPAAITGLNISATYNGMSNFSVCLGEEYDDLWISVTIDSNSVGVGANKTVTDVNVTTPGANYTIAVEGVESFTVTPVTLTVEWTDPADLRYDGTAKEATAMILDGMIPGDDVQLNVALRSGDDNVAEGSTFHYDATLTGAAAGNYVLAAADASREYTVLECAHTTLNERGICPTCEEFMGISDDEGSTLTGNMTIFIDPIREGEKRYYRIEMDYNVLHNIKFNGGSGKPAGLTYTAYLDTGDAIDLTETPKEFVTSDYLYIVFAATEDVDMTVTFEIEETTK